MPPSNRLKRGSKAAGFPLRSPGRKWNRTASLKANQFQAVADLSLLGLLGRPGSDALASLTEFRLKAFLALNKKDGGDELLAAAKSYYNVCDLKALTNTSSNNAVNYMLQALAKRALDTTRNRRQILA